MPLNKYTVLGFAAAMSLGLSAGGAITAQAADLRIGLQDDPDILDPDQSRTFVGRIVYASMCDKLVDIMPDLTIIPQLATSWDWSDDGKTLWLVFSGRPSDPMYSFNLIQAKLDVEM